MPCPHPTDPREMARRPRSTRRDRWSGPACPAEQFRATRQIRPLRPRVLRLTKPRRQSGGSPGNGSSSASVLCQVCPRRSEVWTTSIWALCKRGELLVICLGFVVVAQCNCRLCCAEKSVQAVRFLLYGRFEGGERLPSFAAFQQHDAVEFERRLGHAGRDGMLLGSVLCIGRRAHGLESVVILALGRQDPGVRNLP